jgi:hypothetical protein
MSRKITNDIFITKFKSRHPTITPLETYVKTGIPILFHCEVCEYEWSAAPSDMLRHDRRGCPKCSGRVSSTTDEMRNKLQLIHGKTVTMLEEFISSRTPVKIQCNICGDIRPRLMRSILRGVACVKCDYRQKGLAKAISKEEFMFRVHEKHGNNITFVDDYVNMKTNVTTQCVHCNRIRTCNPADLLNSHYCICHSKQEFIKKFRRSKEWYTNELRNINTKIEVVGDYIGIDNNILVRCTECFHEWAPKAGALIYNRTGCPICNVSKGETAVQTFLTNNAIPFEPQKTFDDLIHINKLRFDFYLPKLNVAIEVDGIQHRESVAMFGGDKTFEYIKFLDSIKDKYCLDNGIKLIRLPYDRNPNQIIDILKSKFS